MINSERSAQHCMLLGTILQQTARSARLHVCSAKLSTTMRTKPCYSVCWQVVVNNVTKHARCSLSLRSKGSNATFEPQPLINQVLQTTLLVLERVFLSLFLSCSQLSASKKHQHVPTSLPCSTLPCTWALAGRRCMGGPICVVLSLLY